MLAYSLVSRSNLGERTVAEIAGVNHGYAWLLGKGGNPSIGTFEAFLAALGYRLAIVPKDSNPVEEVREASLPNPPG